MDNDQGQRKKPGRWTEYEDSIVRSGAKSNRSIADVAWSLNRLESSVAIRAKVIGFPFVENGDA